ncbi:hypothetical protein CRG98_032381 [Punica granatum]|uniref:Uncharacterized protein n=1 Tax=Punica granatum TaxID=22663 RepID=A0A2I0ITC6_PUNGR|nr:hypothetical protein CRG98_032381 [Punica granatum]
MWRRVVTTYRTPSNTSSASAWSYRQPIMGGNKANVMLRSGLKNLPWVSLWKSPLGVSSRRSKSEPNKILDWS